MAIPAASLEMLSMVTDGLVSDTLEMAIEAMAEEAAKVDGLQEETASDALKDQEREQSIKRCLHMLLCSPFYSPVSHLLSPSPTFPHPLLSSSTSSYLRPPSPTFDQLPRKGGGSGGTG